MTTVYITLAQNQVARHFPGLNTPNGGGYVEVTARDWEECMRIVGNLLGVAWAFQYDALDRIHPLDRTRILLVRMMEAS